MPTLRTTIALESSNLLASALDNTKVVNQTVDGGDAQFEQNQIPGAETETLYESTESAGTAGVIYFYCESASTNPAFGVDIAIQNKSQGTASFSRLLPGDFMYLPLFAADAAGIMVTATNTDPANPATINYFFGSKN